MDWRLSLLFTDLSIAERFDRAIEVLLIVLLVFMPLALGPSHAWGEEVVIILSAGLCLVFLLKLVVVPSVPFVWSWVYVPAGLFVLLVVFQILPLPSSLVARISPATAAVKTSLLDDLPNVEEVLSSMTLSFYPHATRHDLRLVLVLATVLMIVINVCRRTERIKRLLAAVAIIGGGIALLALVQDVAGNGKIYWLVPTDDRAYSGTFLNRNHYGQFMNLSMGAALGLLCVILYEAFTGRYVTPAGVADYLASPAGKPVLLLVAMILLGVATIFLSLTRAGMIGMLIAAGLTTLMMSWRRSLRGHGWIMVLLAMGAFMCILYVGFDQVYDQLATLQGFHRESGGRWQIVRDVAVAWTEFPVFGTGLGTREVVYPMFNRLTAPSLAMYAENVYAQTAEETGCAGLLCLIFLGTMAGVAYGRNIASGSIPIRSAAYGLGFGLLTTLIHGFGHFGQHLPANAVLSTLFVAMLIALVHAEADDLRFEVSMPRRGLALAGSLMALILGLGVWAWAIVDANAARVADARWAQAKAVESRLNAANWKAPPQAYEYLLTHAMLAAEAEPENICYQHRLGAYKWLSLAPYVDPNTGALQPEALSWARQIVEELHQARPLCPTFGALYCVAGEIKRFALSDPTGADEIRKGYRLSPCDATSCLIAARMDAKEGKIEEAFEKLERAVQLDGTFFPIAAQLCIDDLGGEYPALQLAGGDADRLVHVMNLLASSSMTSGAVAPANAPRHPDGQRLLKQARAEAFEQLRRRCELPNAPAQAHALLASFQYQQGDFEQALQHYRHAVRLDYGQISWHYAMAQLLSQMNRIHEAMHEAHICLRFKEDYAPAKELLLRLGVDSTATLPPSSGG